MHCVVWFPVFVVLCIFFFFKQKTAYEMRISDWSSDVCSSDLDRLQDIVLGESAVGTKNVTINEPFFQGHFPAQAVMPGVLIVEAMAQTAAALVMYTLGPEAHGKLVEVAVKRAAFGEIGRAHV